MDKLNFRLAEPIATAVFLKTQRNQAKAVRETRLRGGKWHLQLGPARAGIFVEGGSWSDYLHKVVTRPSAFPSFSDYFGTVEHLFGKTALSQAIIERVDLAVDYPLDLETFLACFDVSRKRARVEFLARDGRRTGLNVGKGSEKLVIYDKARQARIAGPLTRLEVQISGKKLPCRSFTRLNRLLAFEERDWSPFSSVRLHNVDLPELMTIPTERLRERLKEFKILLRRDGFLSARLKLGRSRNFKRDYQKWFNLNPWTETPTDAVKRDLRAFRTGIGAEKR